MWRGPNESGDDDSRHISIFQVSSFRFSFAGRQRSRDPGSLGRRKSISCILYRNFGIAGFFPLLFFKNSLSGPAQCVLETVPLLCTLPKWGAPKERTISSRGTRAPNMLIALRNELLWSHKVGARLISWKIKAHWNRHRF